MIKTVINTIKQIFFHCEECCFCNKTIIRDYGWEAVKEWHHVMSVNDDKYVFVCPDCKDKIIYDNTPRGCLGYVKL